MPALGHAAALPSERSSRSAPTCHPCCLLRVRHPVAAPLPRHDLHAPLRGASRRPLTPPLPSLQSSWCGSTTSSWMPQTTPPPATSSGERSTQRSRGAGIDFWRLSIGLMRGSAHRSTPCSSRPLLTPHNGLPACSRSDACCAAGRPLVSGAAIGTDGQLTVYCHGEDGASRDLAPAIRTLHFLLSALCLLCQRVRVNKTRADCPLSPAPVQAPATAASSPRRPRPATAPAASMPGCWA